MNELFPKKFKILQFLQKNGEKINIFEKNQLKKYSKIKVSIFQNRGYLCYKKSCVQ